MMRRVVGVLVVLAALIGGCGGASKPKPKPPCATVFGTTAHKRAITSGEACKSAQLGKRVKLRFKSAPTAEQFDSVTVSTVPRSAHYVAGYVDGAWQTYYQMKGRWPVVVSIAVYRGSHADCIDLEPGNPGPDAARPFVLMEWAAGNQQPCVYSMLSWMGQIRANLAGLAQCSSATQTHCYRLWDADWRYSPGVDNGFNCTQWTDRSGGLNLDESTCLQSFYPQSGPPPDPYGFIPHGPFQDGNRLVDEYWTVRHWDEWGCQNPVRRHQCVVDRDHLIFTRGRTSYLAHHVWGTPAHPNWAPNYGGLRWRTENLRVNATHPTHAGEWQ